MVIDKQLQEFNNHFNEINTELLLHCYTHLDCWKPCFLLIYHMIFIHLKARFGGFDGYFSLGGGNSVHLGLLVVLGFCSFGLCGLYLRSC